MKTNLLFDFKLSVFINIPHSKVFYWVIHLGAMSVQHLYQRVPPQLLPTTYPFDVISILRNHVAPYNPNYARQVLQRWLENNEADDDAYELLAELLDNPSPSSDEDTLGYVIGDHSIWIKENPRIISGQATTGLRTWEAAVYLSNYLYNHQDLAEGKSVIELGAGTGLVSLLVLKWSKSTNMIVTDGTAALIDRMDEAMTKNGLDRNRARFQRLWWGEDHYQEMVNVVVGADITYDALVVPVLVETIGQLFDNGATLALIAATIRNEDTIKVWDEMVSERFNVEIFTGDFEGDYQFPVGTPQIRIYKMTKLEK